MESPILLIIYQGETFYPPPISYVDQNWCPISLVGYSAVMSFGNECGELLMQATTANGQLSINAVAGTIQPNIPASEIAPLAPICGNWDLFLYSPQAIVSRIAGGRFEIRESVTG